MKRGSRIDYLFLTVCRDFYDNDGAEIFDALGHPDSPTIFSTSEP